MSFIHNLQMEHYEAVIDFQGLLRTGIWSFLTKCPNRIGFSLKEARHKLNCLFTNIHVSPETSDLHIVQKNLSLLKPFEIFEHCAKSLAYVLDEVIYLKRDELMRKNQLNKNDGLLGIHIGSSWRHSTKCWPTSFYSALLEKISPLKKTILFWGPDEEKKILEIPPLKNVIVTPKLSLLDLAAWIKACSLFVGSDSGPIHMAAALGIKTLSLMGPTLPQRLRPWGADHHFIYKDVDCSLCLKNICFKQHQCMKMITVDEVYYQIHKICNSLGLSSPSVSIGDQ